MKIVTFKNNHMKTKFQKSKHKVKNVTFLYQWQSYGKKSYGNVTCSEPQMSPQSQKKNI